MTGIVSPQSVLVDNIPRHVNYLRPACNQLCVKSGADDTFSRTVKIELRTFNNFSAEVDRDRWWSPCLAKKHQPKRPPTCPSWEYSSKLLVPSNRECKLKEIGRLYVAKKNGCDWRVYCDGWRKYPASIRRCPSTAQNETREFVGDCQCVKRLLNSFSTQMKNAFLKTLRSLRLFSRDKKKIEKNALS